MRARLPAPHLPVRCRGPTRALRCGQAALRRHAALLPTVHAGPRRCPRARLHCQAAPPLPTRCCGGRALLPRRQSDHCTAASQPPAPCTASPHSALAERRWRCPSPRCLAGKAALRSSRPARPLRPARVAERAARCAQLVAAVRNLLTELDLWQLPRYVLGSSAGSMLSIYLASRMQFQARRARPPRSHLRGRGRLRLRRSAAAVLAGAVRESGGAKGACTCHGAWCAGGGLPRPLAGSSSASTRGRGAAGATRRRAHRAWRRCWSG